MMIEAIRPYHAPSRVEKVLAEILSPHRIGALLVMAGGALMASSWMLPSGAALQLPALAQIGQNTMLGFIGLGILLRPESDRQDSILGPALAVVTIVLGVVALVQAIVLWYPADGWWRLTINTAGSDLGWPGRMSWPAAHIVVLLGITHLLRFKPSMVAWVFAAIATLFASCITTAAFVAQLTGIAIYTLLPSVPGNLSPVTTLLLLLASLASGRVLLRSRQYLMWEANHIGQGVFFRVSAMLSLIIMATVVAAIGYTVQADWNAVLLIILLMVLLCFLIIYQRIVSVVDGSVHAHARLHEHGLMLAQAQTQAQLGSWRLKLPEGVLEWSPQCYEIFQLTPGTVTGMEQFLACIHPDDRSLVLTHWERALTGDSYDIEHRICVKQGIRWVRERAELMWNDDRTQCVCLGTVQDMTESKERELELIRSREQIRRLAAHHELIREEERRVIARELHDEMGQHLTALRLQLATMQLQFGNSDGALCRELEWLGHTVGELVDISRQVAASLRPPALDAGLQSAADWLLMARLQRNGIRYRLQCKIDDRNLPEALKTMIFRVLQESVTNIIKHADASEVLVWITQDKTELSVTVSDNGRGFDPAAVDNNWHFGLAGIRERALMFGGTATFHSHHGAGTTVEITLPLTSGFSAGGAL